MGDRLVVPDAAVKLASSLAEARWGPYARPRYDGFSIPNASVSAFDSVGGMGGKSLLPGLAPAYPKAGDTTTAIVVLVDSFGWKLFTDVISGARTATERSVAEGLLPHALPITTVFPTTTSSALISLSTGTAPGTHGIVGYTEYFPAWGSILNTLKMTPSWGGPRDLAAGRGFKPQDIMTVPTLFRRGLSSVALTKFEFEGSAYTRVLYDGAAFQGYLSHSDLAMHLKRILSQPRPKRPSLIWVYWDLLDSVHHVNGPLGELAVSEITHFFLTLASVASGLGKDEREGISIWVTGDHGQVEVRPTLAVPAHNDEKLMSLLQRPPSGERRAAFLEARSGRKEDLRNYLESHLPAGWLYFTVEEVIKGELFGPEPRHPELLDRLGDFLVVPPPGAAFYYRPPGSRGPEDRFLRGAHGGMATDELLVTLVSLSMEELARWNL
jgi:hypothetical protein